LTIGPREGVSAITGLQQHNRIVPTLLIGRKFTSAGKFVGLKFIVPEGRDRSAIRCPRSGDPRSIVKGSGVLVVMSPKDDPALMMQIRQRRANRRPVDVVGRQSYDVTIKPAEGAEGAVRDINVITFLCLIVKNSLRSGDDGDERIFISR
jgi:hypothetical protein